MTDEKIIERIRKLLALSKSSNIHEAELAMSKVNELLTTHQLSLSEVLLTEANNSKVAEGSEQKVSETYRSFVRDIAQASAYMFDTAVVKTHHQAGFIFAGLKEDILASEVLFDYLFDSWKSMVSFDCSKWKKQQEYYDADKVPQYEVKQYKIAHGQGFAQAVRMRAWALARDRKAKVQQTNTGNALVVVKQDLVKAYMKDNTRPFKGKYREQHNSGRDIGYARGREIPLSGALNNDKQEKLTQC